MIPERVVVDVRDVQLDACGAGSCVRELILAFIGPTETVLGSFDALPHQPPARERRAHPCSRSWKSVSVSGSEATDDSDRQDAATLAIHFVSRADHCAGRTHLRSSPRVETGLACTSRTAQEGLHEQRLELWKPTEQFGQAAQAAAH
jgi:hypothetical protein